MIKGNDAGIHKIFGCEYEFNSYTLTFHIPHYSYFNITWIIHSSVFILTFRCILNKVYYVKICSRAIGLC